MTWYGISFNPPRISGAESKLRQITSVELNWLLPHSQVNTFRGELVELFFATSQTEPRQGDCLRYL
jgi:hypothetical protein